MRTTVRHDDYEYTISGSDNKWTVSVVSPDRHEDGDAATFDSFDDALESVFIEIREHTRQTHFHAPNGE